MTVRIATRRSALARAQAFQAGQLIAERTGARFELVPMATTGDLHPDRPVSAFETKGLFVDSLRQALLDGDCDLAVHSYKDLPTEAVPGVVVGAVPVREDPRDVLVSRQGYVLSTLPATAIVGTSSQRRRCELLRAHPSLRVVPLRGNLDTRLRKVADGEFDAVVVAFAGLRRLYVPESAGGCGPLGLPLTAVPLEPDECLPAPGQGALAIECRVGDTAALAVCAAVDDVATHHAVRAERAYLRQLGGGCLAPVGALGRAVSPDQLELAGMLGRAVSPDQLELTGMLGRAVSPDQLELAGMLACPVTRKVVRCSLRGPLDQPEQLGLALARDIDTAGGAAMLQVIADLRVQRQQAGH